MTNVTKNAAAFLVSKFLSSNRSLKKIYGIKTIHWAILGYIANSIDINYSKRKIFEAKLYQSQIAKFSHLVRQTVNEEIQHLIKKRLLIKVKKNTYAVGKILLMCRPRRQRIEVSSTPTVHRCVVLDDTSNSSKITNKKLIETYKPKAEQQRPQPPFWGADHPSYGSVRRIEK